MTRIRIGLACGVLVSAMAAAIAGCNGILGIDAATTDPTLTDASAGGEGGSQDAGADTASGPATCEGYCTTVMANCTGKNAEYIRIETCLAMCQHLEPGLIDDRMQDSLACRNYHAGAASGDPNFHCRHAGPVGGGLCGSDPCPSYCLLDFALCNSMTPPPFASASACQSECSKFKYLTPDDAGDISFTAGDTLNCRIYHLEAAYDPTNDAAAGTHCPHTATVSAVCFDPVTDGGVDAPAD